MFQVQRAKRSWYPAFVLKAQSPMVMAPEAVEPSSPGRRQPGCVPASLWSDEGPPFAHAYLVAGNASESGKLDAGPALYYGQN
ncbi:hypothetical protein HPB50_020187 [Hyalomma asiaticum]|uniref:Uncharacterized protein n=1 Tax=Hyalomma asiaticum TaxID=266040 RepID=A0ACB7TLC8_HYAAI|nr:hypothetical protein HPB50_020187 [Hyalomma asiaticum]